MKNPLPLFAISALLLGGVISWGSSTGLLNPGAEPDLEALPVQFGPLHRTTIYQVDSGLLGDLPPDRFTFQEIEDEEGHSGKLYIAYYHRGRRWSGRPHELTICYRAIGYDYLGGTTRELADGSIVRWSTFTRKGEEIVVVHWLQRPGLQPGHESASDYLGRMTTLDGLRQDVASVYLEFPAAAAPPEAALLDAAEAVSHSLAQVWNVHAEGQDS